MTDPLTTNQSTGAAAPTTESTLEHHRGRIADLASELAGIAKESWGELTGNDRLREAGRRQANEGDPTWRADHPEAHIDVVQGRISEIASELSGIAKESWGSLTGNDELRARGRQQANEGDPTWRADHPEAEHHQRPHSERITSELAGIAKESWGSLTGNERMREEGRRQANAADPSRRGEPEGPRT